MSCLTCSEDHSNCKDIASHAKIVGGDKTVSTLHRDAETGLSDTFDNVSTMEKLGTIDIKHEHTGITLKQSKENQVQFVQPRIQSPEFDEIKLNHTSSFRYKCLDLRGLSILPDGKILLCIYNILNDTNPIAVVEETGKLLSTIPVPGTYVFDVTVIDQNTAAVTSGYNKTVSIVDIPSSSIKRAIQTDNDCYGITYFNHHLYCCVMGKGIVKISVKEGQTSAFYRTDLSGWSCIAYHKNNMYFTDQLKKCVTCCDMEGRQIWMFEDSSVLKNCRGIAVDRFSNLYIAYCFYRNVVLLSEDGKRSREILTKADGLISPRALFYDNERQRLLVGNQQGKVCFYNFV